MDELLDEIGPLKFIQALCTLWHSDRITKDRFAHAVYGVMLRVKSGEQEMGKKKGKGGKGKKGC